MPNPVPVTIVDVLAKLRASALDERDKGDRFERLVKAVLLADAEWMARFSDVWLWSQWPDRDGRPDTGIDLVARLREPQAGQGEFAAIQCKFYADDTHVAKADIDSFLATSSKAEFGARYIFDTAAGWSKNAEDVLHGQHIPVQRVDVDLLGAAAIDWSQFTVSQPDAVVATGPHQLRPHQERALADVTAGLQEHDRGKLIMACGTGKTMTSLRIAETLVGGGRSVLFLAPSIQLVSQTLREWMVNAEVAIRPFAVCSDVRVGRRSAINDDADMSVVDLSEPATTDPAILAQRLAINPDSNRMTVVFSTYQSIDVIARAQTLGAPLFDLVICDEAHRTTGATLAGKDESSFVRVHDQTYLKATKRVYMTATPRVFGDAVKKKAIEAGAVLADMSDESVYGPELHRLGFGEAVDGELLTDYKVLVLAIDEEYVAKNFQNALAQSGEIKLDDAARLIGCWNGLAKHFGQHDGSLNDRKPMRTAVAFAKDIKASKLAAESFPLLVDRAIQDEDADDRNRVRVQARHVDGTMGIHTRNEHLHWLAAPSPATPGGDDVCRILTNARCLSEGVDVPSLDAVLFLTPRGSQVDVVQSVGRVMRRAPGKNLGYIILPIVVPSGVTPEEALRDNERYRVVWQVLQALRSHDDRFHAMVNSIELNKKRPGSLVIDDVTPRGDEDSNGDAPREDGEQLGLDLTFEGFRDAMYARIVQKVGERTYWEQWAGDVAQIAHAHITRITALLEDDSSNQGAEFARFLDGLRGNLNEQITKSDAIEMLAQHLITRPIFEALFAGYDFASTNPVAQAMERMLEVLDEHNLEAESDTLERFYASVRRRVDGVDNAAGRQRILVELYDKFFAAAFKRTVDKLGIVYTPVEIVDFILRSADDVLRQEFGHGLTDEGVHVLDPFTGTGTFIVRLLQSGLIKPEDLVRKYASELHANEILLLAYYIAAVNIETAYSDFADGLAPFPGLVFADTFQAYEDDDRMDLDIFPANNERLTRQMNLPIKVIVGNPPYSVGQGSANDGNANEDYPHLDRSIRETFGARATKPNFNTLQDSYIRAIRWATLRLGDRGVIAFVTNGGFLDSNSADGMRKTLADEFAAIHVFNLRGNQRTAGEESRREGGKIFGAGSRATVAITVLIKNPAHRGPARIIYTDVGDFLTREEKLARVAGTVAITALNGDAITPNEHGDWIRQRRDDFSEYIPLSGRESGGVFAVHSGGIKTNRDAWAYGFSRELTLDAMQRLVASYQQLLESKTPRSAPEALDPTRISWDMSLANRFERGLPVEARAESLRRAAYRPFTPHWLVLEPDLLYSTTKTIQTFPSAATPNVGIVVTGRSSHHAFASFLVDNPPDLHVLDSGQFFPRFCWVEAEGRLDLGTTVDDGEVVNGYRRIDNITDEALNAFRGAYADPSITKDDVFHYVYGVLHSPTYRETYAADLKKMLPRVPFIQSFRGFADAGEQLAALHIGYHAVDPFALDGADATPPAGTDPYDFYAVQKMRWGKPTAEQKVAGLKRDPSTVVYNEHITLHGIPDAAHGYMLGARSAIAWIIDRYEVKTDKASGIVNDPNLWSREHEQPRYIIDLLARIVTVSVETMRIVDRLPPLKPLNG